MLPLRLIKENYTVIKEGAIHHLYEKSSDKFVCTIKKLKRDWFELDGRSVSNLQDLQIAIKEHVGARPHKSDAYDPRLKDRFDTETFLTNITNQKVLLLPDKKDISPEKYSKLVKELVKELEYYRGSKVMSFPHLLNKLGPVQTLIDMIEMPGDNTSYIQNVAKQVKMLIKELQLGINNERWDYDYDGIVK